jgi:hypothetical protein
VLFQEIRKLVWAKVRQDQIAHFQGGCAPLAGQPYHFIECGPVGKHIDGLVPVAVGFQPLLGHIAPRAPGFDEKDEWSRHLT